MPFLTNPRLSIVDKSTFRLEDDLVYQGQTDTMIVAAGAVTDFASIPLILQWAFKSYGLWTLAAILHDKLCVDLANAYATKIAAQINSVDTDRIFRRVCRELGVPRFTSLVLFVGVRLGALINPARRAGWLRDSIKVIFVTLLLIPILLPVSILVGFGLLIIWLLNKVFK